jgi:hypothetical protein
VVPSRKLLGVIEDKETIRRCQSEDKNNNREEENQGTGQFARKRANQNNRHRYCKFFSIAVNLMGIYIVAEPKPQEAENLGRRWS